MPEYHSLQAYASFDAAGFDADGFHRAEVGGALALAPGTAWDRPPWTP